jgi:hypothetical protein
MSNPITLAEFSSERLRLNGEITKENILHAAKQSALSKRESNTRRVRLRTD